MHGWGNGNRLVDDSPYVCVSPNNFIQTPIEFSNYTKCRHIAMAANESLILSAEKKVYFSSFAEEVPTSGIDSYKALQPQHVPQVVFSRFLRERGKKSITSSSARIKSSRCIIKPVNFNICYRHFSRNAI